MNPFYFNDTVASLIEDFTKEEVTAAWYLWRDEEISVDIPEWSQIVYATQKAKQNAVEKLGNVWKNAEDKLETLENYQWFDSEGNWTINPDILKKVIKDEKWNIYRIVKMEYDFLMKYGLPLPEIHRLERIKLGFIFK